MKTESADASLKLFLCGDVMTARGIDQALPHSVAPALYESYVKNAREYLHIAERENGNIKTPVDYEYIWGEALSIWEAENPNFKLINLETSITTHESPWPYKGINYRMHPKNIEVLKVAGIDHCSLANNHTLDWGRKGLLETIRTIGDAEIKYSGAGKELSKARKPSVFKTEQGRLLVYSYASENSGVPESWAADENNSGINFLPNFGKQQLQKIKAHIHSEKQKNDQVIFSVHWGGNWGYDVPEYHRNFAHQLIDEAGVDVVFGHSSHHPMGMEVYKNKLIIYGAGDFINDYEGISGHEKYRGDLVVMYFPTFNPSNGNLQSLKLIPLQIKKFQLHRPTPNDIEWMYETLKRESEKLGTSISKDENGYLRLNW